MARRRRTKARIKTEPMVAGLAASVVGGQVADLIRQFGEDSPMVSRIANAPEYVVPVLAGLMLGDNVLLSYGVGGIAGVVSGFTI